MISSMLKYWTEPTYNDLGDHTFWGKVKGTVLIYFFYLAVAIGVFLVLRMIDSLIVVQFFHHSIVDELMQNNNRVHGKFLLILFVVPFVEEILFRLPLRLEKIGIGLSFSIITYRLLVEHSLMFDLYDPYAYAKIALAIIPCLLTVRFFPDSWLVAIKKRYSYYFYFIAATFALVHVTNFAPYNNSVLLFYPLFTLPQFLMALVIGYVRMEYGFFYGVALHSLINLPAILISLAHFQ